MELKSLQDLPAANQQTLELNLQEKDLWTAFIRYRIKNKANLEWFIHSNKMYRVRTTATYAILRKLL